jgi:hypothetical protein
MRIIFPYSATSLPLISNEGRGHGDLTLKEGNDFWTGELKSVDAEEVSVNYWATTGRNVASAIFKPAFIRFGAKSGKTILCYRRKKNEEQH